jgi:hypothetical protein
MVDPAMHSTAKPVSTKLPWLRLSLLGAFALCLVFPWLTSTGCEGDKPPSTYSGVELLSRTFADPHDLYFAIGPALLVASAFAALLTVKIAGPRVRLAIDVAALAMSLVGVYGTFLAVELPVAGEKTVHHVASAFAVSMLLAFIADAGTRTVLAAREAWRARRTRVVVTHALRA